MIQKEALPQRISVIKSYGNLWFKQERFLSAGKILIAEDLHLILLPDLKPEKNV